MATWGHFCPRGSTTAKDESPCQKGFTVFKAKTDAEGWLAAEHRQIDLDQWVPPGRRHHRIAPESDPTVGSYATAWLADRSERDANDPMALRPSSVKDYELTLKNHIPQARQQSLGRAGRVRHRDLVARPRSAKDSPGQGKGVQPAPYHPQRRQERPPHAADGEPGAHQGSRPRAQIDADPSRHARRTAGDHTGNARQAKARYSWAPRARCGTGRCSSSDARTSTFRPEWFM